MATHGNIEVVYFYRKSFVDRKLGKPTKHNSSLLSCGADVQVESSELLTNIGWGGQGSAINPARTARAATVMHKGRPILWSQTLARTKYYKNFAKHFDRVLWYLFNNS